MYNHSLFYNHLSLPIFGRNKTGHFDSRWEMLYYVVGGSFSLWAPGYSYRPFMRFVWEIQYLTPKGFSPRVKVLYFPYKPNDWSITVFLPRRALNYIDSWQPCSNYSLDPTSHWPVYSRMNALSLFLCSNY